jgi:hypothetical protein
MNNLISVRLRSENENQIKAALRFAVNRDGVWTPFSRDWAIDLIGPVTTTPATLSRDGIVTKAAVLDMRFHVNLRATQEIIDGINPSLIVAPATPKRIWLGD